MDIADFLFVTINLAGTYIICRDAPDLHFSNPAGAGFAY